MLVSKALLSTIVTARKDDTRPLLTCIRLYKEGENIVSVATDGYILSEVIEKTPSVDEYPDLPHGHKPTEPDVVLMPAATAKQLAAAMGKNDSGLPILNYAVAEADTATTTDLEKVTTLTFRSPEGNYPEYRKLVEGEEAKPRHSVTVNPKYLAQALALFKGDDSGIEISVSTEKMGALIIKKTGYKIKKTAVIMPLKG